MAALAVPAVGLEYPESDGRPMGETDLQIDETIAIRLMLGGYYAERKGVYVTGNNLIYYEQGNVAARVSPDVYVVHGVPKGQRRTYELWEEKKPPSVVIEVTSKGTWLEDEGTKRALYARVGVKEYFLYSYQYAPMPRMTCTFMEDGPHTRDEIIAAVDRGIIAETFTNGQVQIGAGDYTFYVKNGWLVENGKVTAPIKDVNIIGNGPESLQRISMVANDAKLDKGGWTCGKNGQTVPVSLGIPTVLVSKMTVGGENVG
jgi:Uma2 family endonuclease